MNGVKGVRHKLDQPLQQEDHEDNGDNGGPKTRQAFLYETHVEESWGLFCARKIRRRNTCGRELMTFLYMKNYKNGSDLFGKRCNRSRVLDQEHVFPFFISSLHIFKELIKNSELTFGDDHDKATI